MMLPVHLKHDGVFLACRLFVPKRANGVGVAYSHVHAAADEIVPFAHANAIRAAAPRTVELWRIPGGDHRLETIKRAPLFDRIRSVLARGGKR